MEKYPKAKFIIITILVITLVNILALAIILRLSYRGNQDTGHGKNFAQKGFDYLKDQLKLSEPQAVQFKTERDTFYTHVNLDFDALENKRVEMIQELTKSVPDTAVLYNIAESMGDLHGDIKREVVNHMLKLKSFCNPVQVQKLDSMYNILIRTDSPWRKKMQQDQPQKEKLKDK
jgi:hypothetical protein